MPMSKSMAKRLRQSLRRRARNRTVKSRVRSAVRTALETVQQGQGAERSERARLALKLIDKAAGKGVLKQRTASRQKSRLVRRLRRLATAEEPEPAAVSEEVTEEEEPDEGDKEE